MLTLDLDAAKNLAAATDYFLKQYGAYWKRTLVYCRNRRDRHRTTHNHPLYIAK